MAWSFSVVCYDEEYLGVYIIVAVTPLQENEQKYISLLLSSNDFFKFYIQQNYGYLNPVTDN